MAQNNGESLLKKYQSQWQTVENTLKEGAVSSYKMSIIETEKILKAALSDKKFAGKTIEDKLKNTGSIVKNPEKLKYARAMYEKIIKEPGFDISADDTKEIITGYYQAISDISRMDSKDKGFSEKINSFVRNNLGDFPARIRNAAAIIFIFFLAVFLLVETETGRSISALIVGFARFLFYKVFVIILIFIIAAAVLAAILYYWRNGKKRIE